jgi:hypothetical protein
MFLVGRFVQATYISAGRQYIQLNRKPTTDRQKKRNSQKKRRRRRRRGQRRNIFTTTGELKLPWWMDECLSSSSVSLFFSGRWVK